MRTIEFSCNRPAENAVCTNGPRVESRSQIVPKCASTTLFSVGSPRMHTSAAPPCDTRWRDPAA